MEWTCRHCKTEWESGFFGNNECPQCVGTAPRVRKLIVRIVVLGFTSGLGFLLLAVLSFPLFEKAVSTTTSLVDARTLYTYGPWAYADAVANGKREGFYTLESPFPAYKEIPNRPEEGTILPRGQKIHLEAIVRRGADVWAGAVYYRGDDPLRVFVKLPRNWESVVSAYDLDALTSVRRSKYAEYVNTHFPVEWVIRGEEEARFVEEHPDFFLIPDLSSTKKNGYTSKTNRTAIEKVHDALLAKKNLYKIALQNDPTYRETLPE